MANDPLIGFACNDVRFDRLLGRGGMGTVYQGQQLSMQRPVAIKVIAAHLMADERYRERFTREAQVLGRLVHPNIIACHDIGRIRGPSDDDLWIMVLEYIDGWSLGTLCQDSRLTVRQALELLAQVATGLAFAHRLGVVHRDIKPDNILVGRNGAAKIADFGLARMEGNQQVTQTGAIIGTPAYMSPEACRGETLSPASDIYSFGCTLYQVLTDRHPYPLNGSLQIIHSHLHAPPPDLRDERPDLLRLQPILARCVAKRPQDRWPDAHTLAEALRAEITHHDDTVVAGRLRRGAGSGTVAAPTEPSALVVPTRHPLPHPGWRLPALITSWVVAGLIGAVVARSLNLHGPPAPPIVPILDLVESDLQTGNRIAALARLTTVESMIDDTRIDQAIRERISRLRAQAGSSARPADH